uniref:Capsid protein n=1 Tax=Cressdnaviricota sp. TaxID=2748378 RepID=A0A6M3YPC2_9VIRU|nr:MAG: capsid protein [Cressdnaviricota sp.]
MSIVAQRNFANRHGATGLVRAINNRIGMARNRFRQFGGRALSSMRVSSASRQRAGRSFTMNKRRKSKTVGIGVTEQHDARVIYRRKAMPGRKKRTWKKFRGKVLAVSEKDLGTSQVVFNTSHSVTNQTPGQQVVDNFALYSLKSSISYWNDLSNISGFIAGAATTTATGLAVGSSSKVIFKSGVLDLTIRNTSTNNGAAAADARMEVDVYELQVRHTAEETGASYADLLTLFAQNIGQTLPIGGGLTTEIDQSLRGTTPFDFSYVLSRFGVRINSKTKYQISNGDQVTYQVRDPARRSTIFREMVNQDGFNKPGWTRCIYIIGKLAPGLTVGAVGTPGVYQENLTTGVTRKYTFKVENWSEDRTAYLVA